MIVCRSCGSHNADADTFCGSCGEFLEWSGEKLDPPGAHGQRTSATATGPSDPSNQPPPPAVPPGPEQPAAVLPQAPTARRRPLPPTPAPPSRRLQPDDLICGACGEGNPPTRRFCSRCGASLHTATVVPTPWWQSLLKRFQRHSRPAGDRPRRPVPGGLGTVRGVLTLIRRVALVGVLLLGLLYAAFPPVRSGVNDAALGVRDRIQEALFQKYVPVRPTSVGATAEDPANPAGNATDGFSNTFWLAPDSSAILQLGFDRPADLVRALVHSGGGEDFQAFGRPERLHLVYSTGATADVILADTPEPQEIELTGGEGATSVEIHIASVYRSVRNPAVAISEIELYERQ